MFDLKGKVALVTGSSRGIGKEIAVELARNGAAVMIHGVQEGKAMKETVEEISKLGGKVGFFAANLSDELSVKKLYEATIKQLGEIDIFVANASLQIEKDNWLKSTRDEFTAQMFANVWSTMEMCQLITPKMIEKKWGRILTIGSVQQEKPHYEMITYAASKSAQMNFVKNLAKILAKDNIMVNNLAPGLIDTDRNKDRIGNRESLDEILSGIPLKRAGHVSECAKMALLLCSEASSYMTGGNYYVDGGASL